MKRTADHRVSLSPDGWKDIGTISANLVPLISSFSYHHTTQLHSSPTNTSLSNLSHSQHLLRSTSATMMSAAHTQPHYVFARTIFGQESYPACTRRSPKATPPLPPIREESADHSAIPSVHLSPDCYLLLLTTFFSACLQNSERQGLSWCSWHLVQARPCRCVSGFSRLDLLPESANVTPCKQYVGPS